MPVGPRAGDFLAQLGHGGGGGRRRGERGTQVQRAGGGEQFHGQHGGQPVHGPAQLAGRGPAHGHVVLLHGAARDRVDRRRHGQPLELGHHRGLRVVRDHVAGVHAGVVGQERRQAVRPGHVQHPVGAAFGDAGHVGHADRQEVQHVADRRAVEVPVGLDAAVGEHDGIVHSGPELAVADEFGVGEAVARGAVDLRGTAQRVGVLDAVAVRATVALDDLRALQRFPHPGR